MYQAIVTKYLGPTDIRGSRVKASSSGGHSLTLHWDDALNSDDNHIAAAKALATKLGWDGQWHGGGMPPGNGCVFVLGSPDPEFTVPRIKVV